VDTLGESNTSDSIYPSKPRDNPELPQGQPGQHPGEANKGELLEIFWRGRWIIVAAVVVAIGAAVLYLQSTTPLYASSSSIYVSQTAKVRNDDGSTISTQQDAYYLATQVEVIRSSSILNLAADELRLRHVRSFESSDSPVTLLKLGLSVDLGKLNDVITVGYESPSPEDSAQAVNAIVGAYQKQMTDQRKSTAGDMLKILQKQFSESEAERSEKSAAMVNFRNENPDVDYSDQANPGNNALDMALNGTIATLTQAQMDEAQAHAEYELAQQYQRDPIKLRLLMVAKQPAGSGPGLPNFDTQEVQQYRAYETGLQAQLDDLLARLGTEHPEVKRVQRQLALVHAKLVALGAEPASGNATGGITDAEKQLADVYIGGLLERWNLAKARVESLNDSFTKRVEAERGRAKQTNNKAVTYQLYKEEFNRVDQLCNGFQVSMSKVTVSAAVESQNTVSILEVGKPSLAPSKPQKTKTVGIALMLGLGLGLGLAFLNGWMDQRFRSAEDVGNSLNLPILGAVPQISGREAISVRGRKSHLQPISDYAEACRAIRTAIYFGMPDSQAKTLLVTSPLPGDGKSTAASNLAIVMAQAGQKTLILDADYRRPNQQRIFELDNTIGSTNVLAGTATLEEAIKPTGIKGVDLLPCGPTPSHPAELLNSQSFADLLQELSKRYDHVVVDSPPVMPVTDARILGAICDATVFVVRAEKSTRKVSVFARDVLQSVGTNILGVMINGLSRGRGYYDAGYYQYGYGGKGSGTRKGNAVPPVESASESMLTPELGSDEAAVTHEESDAV
jgi:capsular exopolysaccharide synthesis family protein